MKKYLLSWMLIAVLLFSCDRKENIVDTIQDGDLIYTLESRKGSSVYGDVLMIYKLSEHGAKQPIYESDFLDLKPWKIKIADVDGDGEKEILLAVHKTTHYDDQEKNRMFIFNFDGEKLYKKWTGSRIAGVWKTFYVGNLLSIPGEELMFIEQVEGNGERLCIYYWFDFGFRLLATGESYDEITSFAIVDENRIHIKYKRGGKQGIATLMVKDGKIIETTPVDK